MTPFYNRAVLNYNNTVIQSNIVQGSMSTSVEAVKAPNKAYYMQGDEITYTLSLLNTSDTDKTGLEINDNLGYYGTVGCDVYPLTFLPNSVLYYQNGVLMPTPKVTSALPLVITGITVPANGNAIISYTATVNNYARLGTGNTIVSTAYVLGDDLCSPVSASATVSSAAAPMLNVVKVLVPSTVSAGDTVVYTIRIENYGPVGIVSTDNVTLSDAFSPVLQNPTVTFNGAIWSNNTQYDYSESTGIFTTRETFVTVPGAVYSQDQATCEWAVTPGVSILQIAGTICG